MATDGTFRYVQNIAGWTARPEVHKRVDPNIQPCDWRPKAINYTIKKGVKWPHFQSLPSYAQQLASVDPHTLRTLWAIDCSGSVSGTSLYHNELRNIVSEYYKSGDEIYLWDSGIKYYSYSQLQSFYNNMQGWGGTESSLIAQIAKGSSIREYLLIVTDGGVNGGAIDRSDALMKGSNIKFKFVTTFIIGTGSLSVGAPYSRGCQNVTYSVQSPSQRKAVATLSPQDLATLNNIDSIRTYSDFCNKYNNLDSAIQATMLGKNSDSSLKQKLNSLQQRIVNNGMNSTQKLDFDKKYQVLYRMADGILRNNTSLAAIAAAKKQT